MKKLTSLFLTLISSSLLISCSSMDSDAKKAADLNKKSLEYVKEQNLEKAEKLYKESQEIIAKYKDTEQYKEFERVYFEYMVEESSKN
ncbi:MAG: hypothetical protein ACK5KT_08685 [Dysgonomonas sp.]